MVQNAPTRLIIDHQGRREVFEVLEDALVVGREPTSGLHLDDHKVSRQHARIRRDGASLRIEDLGSANGTYVNGRPILESTSLSSGDRVDVGGNVILWIGRAPDGAPTTAPNPAPPASAPAVSTTAPAASPPPPVLSGPDGTTAPESVGRPAGARAGRKSHSSRVPLIAAGLIGIAVVAFLVFQAGQQQPSPRDDGADANRPETAAARNPGRRDDPKIDDRNPPAGKPADVTPTIPPSSEEDLARDFELALVDERFRSAWRIVDRFEGGRGDSLRKRLEESMSAAAEEIAKEARARRASRGAKAAADYLKGRLDEFPAASNVHTTLTGLLLEFSVAPLKPAEPAVATSDPKPGVSTPEAPAITEPKPTRPVVVKQPDRAPTADEAARATALVDAAEAALKDGRYAEAEKKFEQASALFASALEPGRIGRRAARGLRRAGAHLGLIDALIATAGKDPGSLGRIPHVTGESGAVLRIDATGLAFQSSDGPVSVAWRVLPKRAFTAIVKKAKLSPEALIDASVWLRSYGSDEKLQEEADKLLVRAFKKDKNLRKRIEVALADARQIPLPEEGFTLLDDEWLSPRQLARRRLNDIVDQAVKDIEGEDDEKRADAVTVLAGLGESARSSLYRALLMRRATLKERLNGNKAVAGINALGKLRLELEKRREHALELIFDTNKYPYPYRPPRASQAAFEEYRKHQPIVDQRVAAVKQIWDDPRQVAVPDAVHELVAGVRKINEMIVESGFGEIADDQNPAPWLMALPKPGTRLSIRNIALSLAERERIDRSIEIMANNPKNPGTATRGEIAQVRITNDYRIMMGRWAVRLYERLTLASHGHCEDMSRLGFFSHTSPVPGKRTPYDRIVRTGMQPSGASENIAINSGPLGAHNGWVHSPGHHRNILGRSWRLMGPGNVGRYWCQNFSVADRNEVRKPATDDESDDDK